MDSSVPSVKPVAGAVEAETVVQPSKAKQMLQLLVTMLRNSPRSQLMLIVTLAGSLALGIVSFIWSQNADYQPLYGSQELYDVSSVTEVLRQENVKFRIHPQSGQVLVDSTRLAEARIKLASSGITPEQPQGLDIMGEEQSLGTSQFVEDVRYKQGLSGELARTIISMKAVRNARVHLAIPKKSSFIRKTEKPAASVFVEVLPGHRLERSQVEAIVNLISSSVTGLPRDNISVVDQKGNLLSRDLNVDDGGFGVANKQLDYTRKIEGNYTTRISTLLEPIVGHDNFRVQVTADVDFNRIEQTSEEYDPENRRVIRSEYSKQTLTDTEAVGGVPGALSNQPPDTGEGNAALQADKANGQTEFTRNYELDRVVRKVTQQQGQVKRLSIAVILNRNAFGEDAAPDTNELKQLVQDAVGFDSERQDQISIHMAGFVKPEVVEMPVIPWWQQPQIITYLRYTIGGLLSFAVIMFLLRPLVKRVANPPPLVQAPEALAAPKTVHGQEVYLDESMALLPPEVADFDTQLVSARKLVDKEPARVAQVVKMWMSPSE
ncbi:flagellar basal-body MS-ring/collar protein FliF [Parendozoicomonas haliclonae]|uniref:Flagellar M-ring protein n=1 Tax=Parendozoicomonas haliclonae TaxID=1960125 RepID=A0A1X7AGC2_9GAMM|nr:flagellar basal-body MS-ring/collar protein FliF [Parendozoicomonas haliclonae]SMA39689.1 Flagellar M-ring protein [Parendozoicomonas haliclonae]